MALQARSLADVLEVMLTEGRRRVLSLAVIFAGVAVVALAIGVFKPKEYESHAIILVEARNIITPLMEGRAVATGVSDQASIATQAIRSHRILRDLLVFGGWGEQEDPRAEQRMLTKLSSRIRISRMGPELIKLSYVDTDPERCHAIATKLAETFIHEASFAKSRQSSEAFVFIDHQVSEYAVKMAEAHAAVQAYTRAHPAPATSAGVAPQRKRPPRSSAPSTRAAEPLPSSEELAALRAEEAVLAAQLGSGELREAHQRRVDRIAQLQRGLDAALGTYTEKHPYVARLREELQNAQRDDEEATRREQLTAQVVAARLDEVRSRISGATGEAQRPRPAAAAPAPAGPEPQAVASVAPGGLQWLRAPPMTLQETVMAQDSTLADLLRRYESTRDVYQDLLKRRENARVSMELDAEQRGLTLRVYEEPEVPLVPAGMRLMHFTLLGLVLAAGAPLGLLFAFVRYDPRIRSARQLERAAPAPLLANIPDAPTAHDRVRSRRRLLLAEALVCAAFATYAIVFLVRVVGVDELVTRMRHLWS